jgi:hypothetical protein
MLIVFDEPIELYFQPGEKWQTKFRTAARISGEES